MYTLQIVQDDNATSPRDPHWTDCNLGVMICFHRRYNLGDDHSYNFNHYSNWAEMEKQLIKDYKNDIILPIYMYDHSGITINTTGFSCGWDSGQVGFIIADRDQVLKCMGWKKITKARKEKLYKYLLGEAETYDQFITGDVWGYQITNEEGEEVDACWGYFGREYCEKEGQSALDYLEKAKIVNNFALGA
jgi:hypothetical protein